VSASIHKFGDFELEPSRFELRRNGRVLKLERIPLELLILLVEKDGDVATRQEIIERLWGKDVFLDTEHGINTAIRKIRAAIREDVDRPRFLQTVTGKGYRFVAEKNGHPPNAPAEEPPIEGQAPETASGIPSQPLSEEPPRPMWGQPPRLSGGAEVSRRTAAGANPPATSRPLTLVLILTLLVASTLLLFLFRQRLIPTRATQIHSIAVLPLTNLSGDASQEYFADGLTDELITALAQNHALRVVSRTSAMQYKGARRPIADIARELGVDGILEGSVTRSANRVHLTVQLIHAPSDTHIWAESYDRDPRDVISLPEELSQTIAKEVKTAVSPPPPPRHISPEAHDAFLQGRYFWFEGDYDRSKQYFRNAIQLQPDYAAAWAGLADSYGAKAGWWSTPPQPACAEMETNIQKALALDDSVAEVHNSLAAFYLFCKWDWNRAEAESRRVLELDPNYAHGHHIRSYILRVLNRDAEALQEQKKTAELDPYAKPHGLGNAYLCLRQYDAAINELNARAVQQNPLVQFDLSDAYRFAGNDQEAARHMELAYAQLGDQHSADALRQAAARGGFPAIAQWLLRQDRERVRAHYFSPYDLAIDYARLQRKDETLHALEAAVQERSPNLVFLQKNADFDFLHSDPRYQAIVKKMGLPPAY
jgi:TolB-like protein/DNA-binding winged helix-turn-helix (wHTH) protein